MLAEAAGVKKIIIACGRTDLRKGIDGLAQLIGTKYDLNPFEKDVLFLFCGSRCSVEAVVTVYEDFYGKDYPQPFVIRIFLSFILRYARFPEKNMRIKIILDRRCGQAHLHHPAIPDSRIQ